MSDAQTLQNLDERTLALHEVRLPFVIFALSDSRYESVVAGANTCRSVLGLRLPADSLREYRIVVDESGRGKADERDGVPAQTIT